jgi:hypothetical protein
VRTATRPRGVTLTLLDLDSLIEQGQELTQGRDEISLGHAPYAAAEVDGRLYVVCVEGVGWQVDENTPLSVPIHASSPGHVSMMPRWVAELSEREVRERMTGQPVDLADLIRTFGGRLEDNFRIWHRTLGGGR